MGGNKCSASEFGSSLEVCVQGRRCMIGALEVVSNGLKVPVSGGCVLCKPIIVIYFLDWDIGVELERKGRGSCEFK